MLFQTQNLEARGLVAKNPIMVTVAKASRPGAQQSMATCILHLARFAPRVKLGPEQSFRAMETARGTEVQEGATYTVQVR